MATFTGIRTQYYQDEDNFSPARERVYAGERYSYDKQRFEEVFLFDLSLYREGMLYRSFTGERESLEPQLRGIERALRDLKPPLTISPLGVVMKLCDVCREPIRSEARKCPHCHEWLAGKGAEARTRADSSADGGTDERRGKCDGPGE